MVNLLEKLNYTRTTLIQGKEAEGREDGKEMSVTNPRLFFLRDEQLPSSLITLSKNAKS